VARAFAKAPGHEFQFVFSSKLARFSYEHLTSK
jgi:hypothetical protein